MPVTNYLASLQSFLSTNYPQPNALWNYSDNNVLGSDWLYATPTNVWGKTYADFPQSVPGSSPGFNLQACTTATTPTQQCVPVQATVTKPGDQPESLLAGHSYEMVDALYEVMTSAEILLDVTTLTPPTGQFLTAFQNAITYISNKPAASRPVIRILFSSPGGIPLSPVAFLTSITQQLDPTAKMEIYATIMRSSIASWNHSKIVAADGTRALVGGHNMWGPDYLGIKPVFDVSMKLTGSAALHAQDYANNLWDYELWRSQQPLEPPAWLFSGYATYQFDAVSGRCAIKPGVSPSGSLYQTKKALFPTPSTATGTKILAVGRGGNINSSYLLPTLYSYVFPFQEPSDEVFPQLISQAQTSIRMSLQAFWIQTDIIYGWYEEMFLQMAKALQRGVTINIVLSNVGAVAGGQSSLSAPYPGNYPLSIQAKMFLKLVRLNMTINDAMKMIANQFHVASFRYSAEDTYPDNVKIPNHAKTFIVDDTVFYIGSQNLYIANLSEFGYLVEDSTLAQDYVAKYWTPLWKYSSATMVSGIDDDVEVSEELEATQFILDLNANTRTQMIWTFLKQQYDANPNDLEPIKEAMNELIINAGYATTVDTVLEGFQNPYFTQNPPLDQATPQAIRFVVNMMSSAKLMTDFAKAVNSPVKSVDEANQNIDKFLKAQGYHCTALQVRTAFIEVRMMVLSYWAGTYTTWLTPDEGASFTLNVTGTNSLKRAVAVKGSAPILPVAGPTLVVRGEGDVTFDGVQIDTPSYKDNVLSWTAGTNSTGNSTAATLHFGHVIREAINDSYVGFEIFGTVTYPDSGTAPRQGVCSLYGRTTPLPPNPSTTDKRSYTAAIIAGLVGLAALSGAIGYFAFKNSQNSLDAYGRLKKNDHLSPNDVELDSAADTQTGGYTMVVKGLNTQLGLQRDIVKELAQYASQMNGNQLKSLQECDGNLRKAQTALEDVDAATIDALVTAQRTDIGLIQSKIDVLVSDLGNIFDQTATSVITGSTKSIGIIDSRIDDILDDLENGTPIDEEF